MQIGTHIWRCMTRASRPSGKAKPAQAKAPIKGCFVFGLKVCRESFRLKPPPTPDPQQTWAGVLFPSLTVPGQGTFCPPFFGCNQRTLPALTFGPVVLVFFLQGGPPGETERKKPPPRKTPRFGFLFPEREAPPRQRVRPG